MVRPIHSYCDIIGMSRPEQASDPCFYAHDGSTCTILRVHGVSEILSEQEAMSRFDIAMANIAPQFRRSGHAMTITYERSFNTEEDLKRLLTPLRDAVSRKGMNLDTTTDETEAILREEITSERILIAVWTYRDVAVGSQYQEDKKSRREFYKLPLKRSVQDPHGPYESLKAAHFGLVNTIKGALYGEGLSVETLGYLGDGADTRTREDLAEVRRSMLYHETPPDWAPKPAGLVRYPQAKAVADNDISSLLTQTLDRQIMTSAATATTDLRTVDFGGRAWAVMQLTEMPQNLVSFQALKRNIAGADRRRDKMPYRIAFHIEGGAKIPPVRRFMTTIGGLFSDMNKRIKTSFDGVEELRRADTATIVNFRIYATTWVEPYEPRSVLEERRSRLVRALNSWQSPVVVDSATDPIRLLVETAPGVTAVARTSRPFLAPANEVSYTFPFHSDAPAEREGETIFLTADGKPFPFKAHSPMQNSWFSLIFAPPGSGKSVLMNSMNLDFAAYYASALLPFIGMIDIGESSQGFIETLRAGLPSDMRNQVTFLKMRNEQTARDHFVNPFDVGLYRRAPLKREQNTVENFLKGLVGFNEEAGLDALIETVVSELYVRYSDLSVSGHPKHYEPDQDKTIDAALPGVGIQNHDNLTWWAIVDGFGRTGRHDLAERAQRYAMPVLTDVIAQLSSAEMSKRYGEDLCRRVRTQIESANNAFPCFANPTSLDIGQARIVSIDLDPVIIRTPNTEADTRSNMLFFLMARELFVKKVSGNMEELQMMQVPDDNERRGFIMAYWRQRYREIEQIRKRFCFDEFHVTGSSAIMSKQIDQDVRQGRKWGFEIILASQRLSDFEKYVDLASNIFVLKSDSEQDRQNMQDVLGISEAAMEQVRYNVKGPLPGQGATFLLGRKIAGQDSWLLARNRIGPARIWALTTTLEDRTVRKALYALTGDVSEALAILAKRFPTGTCVPYWKLVAPRLDRSDDVADHIAETLLKDSVSAS